MAFMDDLKTDQRTQILVAGIVFFAIAFPVYFNYAASSVDEVQLSGRLETTRLKEHIPITKSLLVRICKRWLNRRYHRKLRCFNG